MSEVGTKYVWIEPEPEPEHHWYEPGSFVGFVIHAGQVCNPYPVLVN